MELKHLVCGREEHIALVSSRNPDFITNTHDSMLVTRKDRTIAIESEDKPDTEEVLQSKYGVKLIKSSRGYMVVDKKRRVRIFKSSTWAIKRYNRVISLMGRD